MDYQSELERMQKGGNYWKPKAGKFKVKALSELEDADPYVTTGQDGKEESKPQYRLYIEVDGEEKTWTMGKGKTMASLEAQLVNLATQHNNKLEGVEFTVIVKFDGNKNDYTIVV